MSIEVLARPYPIYMIGESHCVKFDNLMFRTSWAEEVFLCSTRFHPALMPNQYILNGNYNNVVIDSLTVDGILYKNEALYLIKEPSASFLSGRPEMGPVMVFFAGDMYLQNIYAEMGTKYDFDLPGDVVYGVDFDKSPVSYKIIRNRLEDHLQPFLTTMANLRGLFPRLMVHGLPPRTADSERAKPWSFDTRCDAGVRAKLAVLANEILATTCKAKDIPFIDLWDQTSIEGYLRPEFDLDGLHLNRAAAVMSLEAIAESLYDRTGPTANLGRYKRAWNICQVYEGPVHQEGDWAKTGFVRGEVDATELRLMSDELEYVHDPANDHPRIDWVGYPRAGRSGVSFAEASGEMIEAAAHLFCDGSARALLQAGAGKTLGISHFRPIELAPAHSTRESILPTPLGCRRAILCLGETGAIIQEDHDGKQIGMTEAQLGRLVVYDPSRVRCYAAAEHRAVRFIEIGLMPRVANQPFRIVASGLYDWPVDPFSYSVRGMRAFPSFNSEKVHEREGS